MSTNNDISTSHNEWLSVAAEMENLCTQEQIVSEDGVNDYDHVDGIDEIQFMLNELLESNYTDDEGDIELADECDEIENAHICCRDNNYDEVVDNVQTNEFVNGTNSNNNNSNNNNNNNNNNNSKDNKLNARLQQSLYLNVDDKNKLSNTMFSTDINTAQFLSNTHAESTHSDAAIITELSLSPVVVENSNASVRSASSYTSSRVIGPNANNSSSAFLLNSSSSSPAQSHKVDENNTVLSHTEIVNESQCSGLGKSVLESKYWICVTNLEHHVNDDGLKRLFYPYGADESFTTYSKEGMLFGYVGFEAKEMASLAAAKMDAFIPCHHTQPLHVHVITLDEVMKIYSERDISVEMDKAHNLSDHLMSSQGNTPSNSTRLNITPLSSNVKSYSVNGNNVNTSPFVVAPQQLFKPTTSRTNENAEAVDGSISSDVLIQQCVANILIKVENASSTEFMHEIVSSLYSVALETNDPHKFCEELLKQLLCILIAAGTVENITREMTVNCATVIAHLFIAKLIPGDPFQLASRMLSRGVFTVLQVEGICTLAHLCSTLPYAISKASFWALVSETATKTSSEMLRCCLLRHLRKMTSNLPVQSRENNMNMPLFNERTSHALTTPLAITTTSESSVICPFSTATLSPLSQSSTQRLEEVPSASTTNLSTNITNEQHLPLSQRTFSMPCEQVMHPNRVLAQRQTCSPLANHSRAELDAAMMRINSANVLQQHEEVKRRTVYISHLPFCLPQKVLKELLVCAGAVNKVRVCVGKGYQTLFAFVEMQTQQGAKACMRFNGINLSGYNVRVQAARNPIQDVTTDDAIYSSSGVVVQPCLFGTSDALLIDCVTTQT